MITRLSTLAVLGFWSVSMAWLVAHDLVPAWTARDVPKFDGGEWLTDELLRSQSRIENKYGHRVGTVWTVHHRNPIGLYREDVIWLDNFPGVPELRIEITSDFTEDGDLDEFRLEVFGAGKLVALVGERFSGHLAFQLWVGNDDQLFKVDASAVGMVGDVFRPFPSLPRIEVGQSWRMHVVNPLAAVSGIGSRLIPMLVKVTGTERIETDDGPVDCFVVETDRARAWVNADGLVVRQEMDLPYGGTLAVVAEPFDEEFQSRVRAIELPSGGD